MGVGSGMDRRPLLIYAPLLARGDSGIAKHRQSVLSRLSTIRVQARESDIL